MLWAYFKSELLLLTRKKSYLILSIMLPLVFYLKSELLLISRKKSYLILSIMLPLVLYLIFTAMLDLPKEYETKFYKEYMFSMATFSLSSFCIMTFPLEMIEDKKIGWAKNLFKTPLSPIYYYAGKVMKLMCMFCIAIIALFLVGGLYRGVEMSVGEWMGSGILLWIGASMFRTCYSRWFMVSD